MKIALVCPYDIAYPGGVTRHVTQFAEHAKKQGHIIKIIAPSSGKTRHPDLIVAGRAVPVPIKGGTVSRISLSFWTLPKVREIFNKENFDVIHIHEPGVPLLGVFSLAFAPQGKSAIIVTFHSNMPYNAVAKAYNALMKSVRANELLKKIDALIAVSESARRYVHKYLPNQACKIIPNAVDTKVFNPKSKTIEKFLDGKANILFVGRLGNNEKRKGLKYLIMAFNRLHKRNPDTRLIVVGPGKPDGETKRVLTTSKGKGIVFVGKATAEELPRYYATADIFCSPATHGESFGMVLIEAMASGKPVVASGIEGYREVLPEKAGIKVPPKNAAALEAALELLVNDKALRKKMGANGRRIVNKEFSWDAVALRILSEYEKAIKLKKKSDT